MSKKKHRQSDSMLRRLQRRALTAVCILLVIIMVGLGGYAAGWFANRSRMQRDADRYRAMYQPSPTLALSVTPEAIPEPTATAEPEPEETQVPEETQAPEAADGATRQPVAVDEPIGTRSPGTLIYTLPTAPPVQEAFQRLIEYNPDTVGYLDIPGLLSLPVVQRENDNDHYLTHNFDGAESREGCLFLDGVNRLVPEDDCLIVYGHNMKNGAMFGRLDNYENPTFVKTHPLIRFDTLYENRLYTPFAAFTASMQPGESHYFDVRQFVFDETEFELFTLKMLSRSAMKLPIETRFGDRLLLLVTCDYTNKEGRFILALRQLRPGETEDGIRQLFNGM